MPILGEEGGICPEIDATADDVQRAEFGSIRLPRGGVTEDLPIVAMVCIRVGLPTRYPTESNLLSREANSDHSTVS